MKKIICMSCKFFSMKDSDLGLCRVRRRETGDRSMPDPQVNISHTCDKWQDCGQQYYVRKGWIRAREKGE